MKTETYFLPEEGLISKLSEFSGRICFVYKSDCADVFDNVDEIDSPEKIMEIRAFDESGEFRAYRSLLGLPFKCREISDETESEAGFFKCFKLNAVNTGSTAGNENAECADIGEILCYDEAHCLDIDEKKSDRNLHSYCAVGGGKYHLPSVNAEKLHIRKYFVYDSEGMAVFCDWRIVKLM